MSDPGEYQRTFLQHEKQIRENKFVEAAQSSRKLCVQLEDGAISGEWDALAGVDILRDKIKDNHAMMDSEEKINNYADQCLANLNKFKNCSKDWKCKVSMEDDFIKKFMAAEKERQAKCQPSTCPTFNAV